MIPEEEGSTKMPPERPVMKKEHISRIGQAANEALLSFLYPPRCPVCEKPLPAQSLSLRRLREQGGDRPSAAGRIHPACLARLRRVGGSYCLKCGKALSGPDQEYCYDCRHEIRSFEGGRGLWVYDEVSSGMIFAYKYRRKREYAPFIADSLYEAFGEWIRQIRPQALVPVPISARKRRLRGFNQAALLADLLSMRTGIPAKEEVLSRVRSTAPQKELSRQARRENLSRAFTADAGALEGISRVLLIDDIYTTGSTAQFCTQKLLQAGARHVWVLTACIGAPF